MSPPKNNALVIQNALIHGLSETDFNLQKCISLVDAQFLTDTESGINSEIAIPCGQNAIILLSE